MDDFQVSDPPTHIGSLTCGIPDRYGVSPAVLLTLRGLTYSIPDRSRAGFVTLVRYQDRFPGHDLSRGTGSRIVLGHDL